MTIASRLIREAQRVVGRVGAAVAGPVQVRRVLGIAPRGELGERDIKQDLVRYGLDIVLALVVVRHGDRERHGGEDAEGEGADELHLEQQRTNVLVTFFFFFFEIGGQRELLKTN